MSYSVEHGEWRVKAKEQLLINVLDELEPIQKLLDEKNDRIEQLEDMIAELTEKNIKLASENRELKIITDAKDDSIDELSQIIQDNEYSIAK